MNSDVKLLYIYVVQQDTQYGVNEKVFFQHFLLARHVSDLIGPSSGAFCTSCIRRLCCVVIRILLDTSPTVATLQRPDVLSSTHSSNTYQSLRIQLVQNAPDDGPMRSETCRANKKCWKKTFSLTPYCVSCWTTYIYITRWYRVPTVSR